MRAHAHPVSSDRGSDKPAPCFLRLAPDPGTPTLPLLCTNVIPEHQALTDRVLSTIDTRVLHGACDFNQLCISIRVTNASSLSQLCMPIRPRVIRPQHTWRCHATPTFTHTRLSRAGPVST